MRTRIITSLAILLLIVTAVATVTPGAADDADEQRLDDLETRVAALETRVAEIADPTSGASSSQQNNVTSSSSSSSNNSYTASYSGNGDRQLEVEIENAGTYQVTATTTSEFSAVLLDEAGDVVPDFSIETDDAETVTISGRLEPGTHVLQVSAASTWNVTIILLGD